ncbi:MAG: class I SAM-dependent methyltransferase [Candidatus Ancaeobacter aquaticus]|nr:class I SAM-dependent methyltransferase [Candidatus Ancaeobacter aquaticus]
MKKDYIHRERWLQAQDIEKVFWNRANFRDNEYEEIDIKYSRIFKLIEEKYNFTDSTKILDLGCGATCPSTIFKIGVKYGVDPLVDCFLDEDKIKLKNKIELRKGDGENIPFEDKLFDVVLCRNALDHMDNICRVMQEVARVTKDDGLVILSVYTYTKFIAFLKITSEFIPFLRNVEHPHTFTPENFIKFCEKYFKILETSVVFEGKNSIDYGKINTELNVPFLHKVFAWVNKSVFMNKWFLKEYLIISKK